MSRITGLSIVTADDDDINLIILLKSLKDGGHFGKGFEEGDEVWDFMQARPHEVDIALLDKMMETIDGIELTRLMKEHDILKDVPVIIQSGDRDDAKVKEALDAGVDLYLKKPFTPDELLDAIDKVAKEFGLDKKKKKKD